MRTFKNQMQAFAIKQLLKYVERDPEVNAAGLTDPPGMN